MFTKAIPEPLQGCYAYVVIEKNVYHGKDVSERQVIDVTVKASKVLGDCQCGIMVWCKRSQFKKRTVCVCVCVCVSE